MPKYRADIAMNTATPSRITFVLLLTIAALAPQSTFPQSNEAPDAGTLLEEIIVTATKREQSLQDVPLSITVISEAELDRRGVFDFMDIANSIPNLSVSFSNGEGRIGTRSIAIRGIFGSQTTGFYLDETPIPQSLPIKIVDVNRIEVLRGPQGTLYGAQSMGGTVRVISNRPDLESFSARASRRAVYH